MSMKKESMGLIEIDLKSWNVLSGTELETNPVRSSKSRLLSPVTFPIPSVGSVLDRVSTLDQISGRYRFPRDRLESGVGELQRRCFGTR